MTRDEAIRLISLYGLCFQCRSPRRPVLRVDGVKVTALPDDVGPGTGHVVESTVECDCDQR